MNLDELFKFRKELLEGSIDEDGYISQNSVLENILPNLVETKLVETEVVNTVPHSPIYSIVGFWENE